ncbi:MAG TPA: peroxidase family protein [Beijerinckiaceae bacterium]|jgi:hypothetical protein
MLHGREADPPRVERRAVRPATQGSGYRNLFGAPAEGEIFSGYGDQTEDLLVRLARCLERPYPWPGPAKGARDPFDNPEIPAGYTYLAQLVAHDLTFLSSTLPPLEAEGEAGRNLRSIALDLETVYGGGPVERPYAFCVEPDGSARRRLRIGVVNEEDGATPRRGGRRRVLGRDLPRAASPCTIDARRGTGRGLTEVLVSDPRNDDHTIVAQTVVLFHMLHNYACGRIEENPAAIAGEHWDRDIAERYQPNAPERAIFSSARRVVTLVYRDILRHDLMKRLLSAPVYERYVGQADPFIETDDSPGMPVEFSHAAFRAGHAMIQPSYRFRGEVDLGLDDILRLSSEMAFDRLPPKWSWLIQWSNFYDLGVPPANLSRRIAPSQNTVLCDSSAIAVNDDRDDPERPTGLPRRDLLRGATVGCRTVGSLIRILHDRAPNLARRSPLLSRDDPTARREMVASFLDRQAAADARFTVEERDRIAADPPLVLFCLLEAAIEEDGLRLGVLGSVIVAEVIFRALQRGEQADDELGPDAGALADWVLGHTSDAEGRAIAVRLHTMPDLIRFLASAQGLADHEPSFI